MSVHMLTSIMVLSCDNIRKSYLQSNIGEDLCVFHHKNDKREKMILLCGVGFGFLYALGVVYRSLMCAVMYTLSIALQ